MKKYFSNAENSFYTQDIIESYKKDASLPDDLAEISDDDYSAFMVSPDQKKPHYNKEKQCMEWVDSPSSFSNGDAN